MEFSVVSYGGAKPLRFIDLIDEQVFVLGVIWGGIHLSSALNRVVYSCLVLIVELQSGFWFGWFLFICQCGFYITQENACYVILRILHPRCIRN